MRPFLIWLLSYKRSLNIGGRTNVQDELLQEAARTIYKWQKIALMCQRSTRDTAIAFRIALESPEIDIREDLDNLIRDLSDSIAKIEEQVV